MKEYRIQKKEKNGTWIFEDPYYVSYAMIETAQETIDYQVRRWEFQKTLKHPVFDKSDIEQYSQTANWRIVQRDVTKWEPVEKGICNEL